MKCHNVKHPSSAFTLVELLIVIVIIAILAAITIISYNGISSRAKSSALESSLSSAGKKLATYALQNSNTLPSDKAAFLSTTNYKDGTTTYQYTINTSTTPNLYCITATQDSNTITYHIAGNADGTVNKVIQGPCVGTGSGTSATHQGTAPTTLADGSSCPTGYIVIPGNSTYNQDSFCVMKYEAKIQGNDNGQTTYTASMVPESRATGTPWVNISQIDAKTKSTAAGGHLITEAEWMTIAANVLSVPSNWSTGTVGSGYIYSGHNDNAPANALAASTDDASGYSGETNTGGNQKRTLTLTNGNVIWDLAGNVWEWTDQTITGNQPGLATGDAGLWKQWNAATLQMNGLSQLSRPATLSAAASTWNSSNGVGQFYSNPTDVIARAFIRGGSWYNSYNTGAASLYLKFSPTYMNTDIGFRVAR